MTWGTIPLKRIATFAAGGTPSVDQPDYWADGDDGFPWVAISDMSSVDSVTTTARRISTNGLRAARIELGNPGTILFSMYASLGHTAWLTAPAAWNQAILGLSPDTSSDSRFLRYCLISIRPQLLEQVRSNTQANLNAEVVGNLRLPYPPLDEQCRIADFLDAEMGFIRKTEILRSKQKDRLEQRRWSVFQHLVDSAPNDVLPLRRVLHTLTDGPFGSAFSSSDYTDNGAAVIRLGNIGFSEYRQQDQAYIPMDLFKEFRRHEVREGDLLIAGLGDPRNHAGRACIAPDLGPAIVKGKCFRARVNPEKTSAAFIAFLLSSPIGASAMEGRGSTRSMINLEIVKSATLPIPSYADQLAIVNTMNGYWQSALTAIQASDRQLALLAERRQALITAAVTGQIDVTTAGQGVTGGGISTRPGRACRGCTTCSRRSRGCRARGS